MDQSVKSTTSWSRSLYSDCTLQKMIVLALDTSTERGAIGLSVRSGSVFASSTETARHHGRDLIPRLAATCAKPA